MQNPCGEAYDCKIQHQYKGTDCKLAIDRMLPPHAFREIVVLHNLLEWRR